MKIYSVHGIVVEETLKRNFIFKVQANSHKEARQVSHHHLQSKRQSEESFTKIVSLFPLFSI